MEQVLSNYSTKSMSDEGGYEIIKMAIRTLGLRHKEHITAYAESNERRLAEKHETAKGCEHGASIHIGQDTEKEGKGYFEDRRSAYGPLRCYFYDS